MPNSYQQTAEDLWFEHAPAIHKALAAPAQNYGAGGLAVIIQWLRDNGITLGKILQYIVPIITIIIQNNGNVTAIIAALLALFGLPSSTPTPSFPPISVP